MSFDKETRNLLAGTVSACRRRLTEDVTDQLRGVFGLHPDGTRLSLEKMTHLSVDQAAVSRRLRDLLDHYAAGAEGKESDRRKAAYERLVLEISFTILNRLAALRLCEERSLVLECVRQGTASDGFRMFESISGGALGTRYDSYRTFLECLFDELALDLGVLFDRLTPQSAIFPTERCTEDVLGELNRPELAHLWTEDETMGWIYQYFNPPEERKAMRDASSAPRNSRELAVRNQFFTPRYVVEFLTDNTLGRIWYEMRKGDTALEDECRYLVRRKHPIFLENGQTEPQPYDPATGTLGDPDLQGDMWLRPNPELSGIGDIFQYALTVGGYDYAKEHLGVECGDLANERLNNYHETGEWKGSFEEMRCCLFFEQRRYHHFGTLPSDNELEAITALHSAICIAWDIEVDVIPHRLKKDPRDIRILDPACGSGHFLLYAFDLLERIYEETWADPHSPASEATGYSLREDYTALEDLRIAVPELIIRWNLHGIDIDQRCTQIAALSLWLRTQKSWKTLELKAADRPQIVKSNIVTAEPMPGEEDIKDEFVKGLRPRVLGQLVEVVFEKMKLAGEAGPLLNIEDEINEVVAEAKEQWLKEPEPEQQLLFPEMIDLLPKQQTLRFDLEGVTDEQFWEQAEEHILSALKEYAEKTEYIGMVSRRLFTEDAARGFGFIDLCRKSYDVALMNPPFGEATESTARAIQDIFGNRNLFSAFISRCLELAPLGLCGAITDSTWLKKTDYSAFRAGLILKNALPYAIADLGWGVLDGANVATCASIFGFKTDDRSLIAFRLVDLSSDAREAELHECITVLHSDALHINNSQIYLRPLRYFETFPENALAYETPPLLTHAFSTLRSLEQRGAEGRRGYTPGDTFRFFRCWWEVQACERGKKWWTLNNGSPFAPLIGDRFFVAMYESDWQEYRSLNGFRLESKEFFGSAGIGYGKRTDYMYTYPLPAGAMFSNEGHCIFAKEQDKWPLIAYLNSSVCQALINLYCGQHKTAGYVVKVPTPCLESDNLVKAGSLAEDFWIHWRRFARRDETDEEFAYLLDSLHGESLTSVEEIAQNLNSHYLSTLACIDEQICSILGTNNEQVSQELGALLANRPVPSIYRVCSMFHSANDNRVSPSELLQLSLGIVLGRWDLRISMDPTLAPKPLNPFDPLPICPPGTLFGPNGLPAESGGIVSEEWLRARRDVNALPQKGFNKRQTIPDAEYTLRVSWNGILVDDPGWYGSQPHRDDIVQRIREVLDLLFKDKAYETEQGACELLRVSELRDYFRKPSGFFEYHRKRYTKGQRKAPIYWPLSTASGSYTIWLYYHRLDGQILYSVVNNYVEPKIAEVELQLTRVEDEMSFASGREATRLGDKLNEGVSFLSELRDFRDELLRVAGLPYKPDLNDGVIINAAPLYKLFRNRQWAKDTEACWKKLEKGEIDWSHMAYNISPERVREVCRTDRSIAIAHGLEDVCEVNTAAEKKEVGRGRKKKADVR